MIKTIVIDSLDGIMQMLSEQDYNPEMNRYRSSFLYRGMSDSSFELVSSLKRNCKHQQKTLEPVILRSFTKYAVIDDPSIEKSIWRQMIIGQHHGLPSRLLDWTHSPLIGLHYATTEGNMDRTGDHDCVVWRIDIKELHRLLPKQYQALLKRDKTFIMSVDMLNEATNSLEQYDTDMQDNSMVIIEPSSIDPRIINQYSYFTVIPSGMDNIQEFLEKNTYITAKYIICKELRWRVRDMLDQLNINERIVYPGLDGLSKWLTRHYYVM